jgi:hypothetical protein
MTFETSFGHFSLTAWCRWCCRNYFDPVQQDDTQEHLGCRIPKWSSALWVCWILSDCVLFVVTVDDSFVRLVWVRFIGPCSNFITCNHVTWHVPVMMRYFEIDTACCMLRLTVVSRNWCGIHLTAVLYIFKSWCKIWSTVDTEIPVCLLLLVFTFQHVFIHALFNYSHLRVCERTRNVHCDACLPLTPLHFQMLLHYMQLFITIGHVTQWFI